MDAHSEAVGLIETEVADLEAKLSATGGDRTLIKRKDSLVNSLRLLRQLSAFEVEPKAKIHTLPLPQSVGAFSEFRLMDDQETEDRNVWMELEIEGEPVRAIVGDIIILNSEKRKSGRREI